MDLGLNGIAVEVLGSLRVLLDFPAELLQFFDLVGLRCNEEFTVLLETGVDRVAFERRDKAPVVLPPQPLELFVLAREVPLPVRESVRQRRVREAAVASGRALRDSIGLDQDDVPIGSVFFRLQRCPQSGEATADDRQVGIFIASEIRSRLRTLGSIEPVATGLRALKCLFVSFDVGLSSRALAQ